MSRWRCSWRNRCSPLRNRIWRLRPLGTVRETTVRPGARVERSGTELISRITVEPFPVFSEALDLSTGEYRAMLHTVNLSTTTYEEQEAEDELLRSSFVAVLPAFDARSHRALLESDDEDGENRAFPLPKRLVRVAKSTNVPSSTIKKSSNALLGGRKPAVTTGGTPKPKWGSSLPVSTGPATRREPPMSLARAPRQPLVALALPLPASLPRLSSRPVAAVSRSALLKPSSKLSSIQISTTLVGSSSEESLLGVFGIVDSEGFDDLDFAALDLDDDARSEFTFGDEGAEGF